jgi:hypothetical protein
VTDALWLDIVRRHHDDSQPALALDALDEAGCGARANQPLVAALVGASGSVLGEPLLRDTADARHAVRSAVPPQSVRVVPPHDRVLALAA